MYNLLLKHVFKLGYSRCFNTKKKKKKLGLIHWDPKKKKDLFYLSFFSNIRKFHQTIFI